MLIDILLTSLSTFTSSKRTTVSLSRLHQRIKLYTRSVRRASGFVQTRLSSVIPEWSTAKKLGALAQPCLFLDNFTS
jgi:hypothetical protein